MKAEESVPLQEQKDHAGTDIFTGLPFRDNEELTDAQKERNFRDYIAGLDENQQAKAYVKILSIPTQEQLDMAVEQALEGTSREDMEELLVQGISRQAGMNESEVAEYLHDMSDEDLGSLFRTLVEEQVKQQTAMQVQHQTAAMTQEQLAGALQYAMATYTTAQCAVYYDAVLEFSDSTYERNLRKLSDVNLDNPATINLYSSSFENKDVVEESIVQYNANVEELRQIQYTDYVGIMMSSITTIINAITYVLIAFVAISK